MRRWGMVAEASKSTKKALGRHMGMGNTGSVGFSPLVLEQFLLQSIMCSCWTRLLFLRVTKWYFFSSQEIFPQLPFRNMFLYSSVSTFFSPFRFTDTDEDTVKRCFATFEEKFFQTCEKELAKINIFYSGKVLICVYLWKMQQHKKSPKLPGFQNSHSVRGRSTIR